MCLVRLLRKLNIEFIQNKNFMVQENSIKLNTGVMMPGLGLGTWKSEPGKVGAAVEYAVLECGYRHIDCAAIYKNEAEIGQAFTKIFKSGKVKREELFVTSKLWNTAHAKDDVIVACKKTLYDLELEYLDLYLMHWGIAQSSSLVGQVLDRFGKPAVPRVPIRETWEAMEELVKAGLVKAIGVANFTGPMLIDLLSYASIKPAMNQIELHPYLQQTRLVQFCHEQGIVVTAYSPLGSPGNISSNEPRLLDDSAIKELALNYHKTPAQILLRWAIQRGTVVIPKSISPERIIENSLVFDFELSSADMERLASLDRRHRYVDPWGWWQIPYFE